MKTSTMLEHMDAQGLEAYASSEKKKAKFSTLASVVPITAIPGAAAGLALTYGALLLNGSSDGLPILVYGVGVGVPIGALTTWLPGAAYSAKKWYNVHRAKKELDTRTPQPVELGGLEQELCE